MDHAEFIVKRLDMARRDRGISVAELSRRIHVDRKRLWYVLNGQRNMHVDEFVRLCAVLNMGIQHFLTREMFDELNDQRQKLTEEFGLGSPILPPLNSSSKGK